MLDDLKIIHERDAQDALGVAEKHCQQLRHAYEFKWEPPREIHDVVIAGMGGSGLAATMAKTWPGLTVPLEVVHDYKLPDFIDEHTLLICSSYSGNTEETLACIEKALEERAPAELKPMIVVVAAGGKLQEIANEQGLPSIALPGGFQPRMTLGYQLRALCEIFNQANLCDGALEQLSEAANLMHEKTKDLIPSVPTSNNQAKQLALELAGSSIVVYSGPFLSSAAYKWKINFNENAKTVAWQGTIPEFNHNEFLGWTSHPVDKPYKVVDLRSNLEHPRVQKRFEVTEQLLSGRRPAPIIVNAVGATPLQQLLWTVQLGDFVSLYLALLNGLNPTPVDLIEKFKKALT